MRGLIVVAAAALCFAQERPTFKVASVKPTQHGRNAEGLSVSEDPETRSPGTLTVRNNSLGELIRWAYHLNEYQVSGPKWLNDDSVSFDVDAKMPPGTTTAQSRLMMRSLLEDRFKLSVHRETRVFPVYELAIARGGPKLETPKPGAKSGLSYEGKFWSELTSESTTAAAFAEFLGDRVGRPVIDKTGIETRFTVNLVYRNSDTDTAHPSLFAEIQEKLGLTLKAAKAPVEMLVIDRIEKTPSEN
jgi:uncharacterized protein (TIGR03435 family)